MKKKVLFMLINMNIGGTEKALLNMINEMPKEKYDITILVLEEKGGFLDYIPRHVTLKSLNGFHLIKDMIKMPPLQVAKDLLIKRNFKTCIEFSFYYLYSKIFKNNNLFYEYISKYVFDEKYRYDIAIAYAGPVDFISFFILRKVIANRKIQWIHFDVTKIGFNKDYARKNYFYFDEINLVSNEARIKFEELVPEVKSKTKTFLNHVSPLTIKNLSKNEVGFQDNFNGIRILTVGRLSFEKGQDKCIRILKKLLNKGYHVRWYCIGDGNAKREYQELVSKYLLQEDFIFLGSNPNPYPFIKQCDIYVQPSRYEGYCLTIMEAKILNKPIVATNVNGVKEQIDHMKTGLITNTEEDNLYEFVEELILNKDLCKRLSNNLTTENSKFSYEEFVI